MNSPDFEPKDPTLEKLSLQEGYLKTRILQQVNLDFLEASRLDQAGSHYLQGIELETPVPTIAFRKDYKKTFLSADGSINRERLYVYVPASEDPYSWFSRSWFKKIDHNGVESMFELDESYQVYETEEDKLNRATEEIMQDIENLGQTMKSVTVDPEVIASTSLAATIENSRRAVSQMRVLFEDLRHGTRHVPYDS